MEVTYEVKEIWGCLAEHATGWKKLVTLTSWNGANPKVDIRDWDPEMTHMGRGITLTKEEATKLVKFAEGRL